MTSLSDGLLVAEKVSGIVLMEHDYASFESDVVVVDKPSLDNRCTVGFHPRRIYTLEAAGDIVLACRYGGGVAAYLGGDACGKVGVAVAYQVDVAFAQLYPSVIGQALVWLVGPTALDGYRLGVALGKHRVHAVD